MYLVVSIRFVLLLIVVMVRFSYLKVLTVLVNKVLLKRLLPNFIILDLDIKQKVMINSMVLKLLLMLFMVLVLVVYLRILITNILVKILLV